MNEIPVKFKIILIISMIFFLIVYFALFGSKNAVIGMMLVMAAFMNLGNDLSFKPARSFIKILILLLILGIAAYLNNPLTVFACILTFFVVFGTTFTSYHLFGSHVYLPFLMCYFMMVGIPISLEELPVRLLALALGAVFIFALNMLVNRKKSYKLSAGTIKSLINEINSVIDLKLGGGEISDENFQAINGFYLSIFNRFEYKYFPSKTQEAVLNIVKSFQYIGHIISNFDLTDNELVHIKKIFSKISDAGSDEIFEDIEIETREMHLVLLNLEIIARELKNDFSQNTALPDRKTITKLLKPIIKRHFSFKSAKFTFAFKMALMIFIWQILTLIFNLPFTKWLYFITLSMMMPYIDDLAYNASARIKGTFAGVFIFTILIIAISYVSIPFELFFAAVIILGLTIMVLKIEDKFAMTVDTTVMSVTAALMYIPFPKAIFLKVLWVTVGVVAVTFFNFKFLPYSLKKETSDNFSACYDLNGKSIELVRQKCKGRNSNEKTTLMVLSNVIRENMEVTDENKELYDLQEKITDACNFILNYLDGHEVSSDLKNILVDIIDKKDNMSYNLNSKYDVIVQSMRYVVELYDKEKIILEG